MTQDRTLAPARSQAPVNEPAPLAGLDQPAEQASILYELHRMLRGRYLWAILLGAIGLVGGAYAGWTLAPEPTYQATGLVQIAPTQPKLIYDNEYNRMLPMFSSFVDRQARLMRSSRVVDLAMDREEWRQTGRGRSEEAVAAFRQSLRTAPSGELIDVSFIDPDPEVARAGVRVATRVYYELYGEREVRDGEDRLRLLENRRTNLNSELQSLRDRIAEIAEPYGPDSLASTYEFKRSELHRIETELRDVQLALAEAGSEEGEGASSGRTAADLTIDELARYDGELARRLQHRTALEDELARVNLGPRHRHVRDLRHALRQAEARLEQEAQAARERLDARGFAEGVEGALVTSIERAREREGQLQRMWDIARAEADELGRKHQQIARLRDEAQVVERRLSETRSRIESLNVESAISGRIEILSDGDRAQLYRDDRVELAGLGGLGGMALGVGAILLLGFFDQRFHTPEDARHGLANAKLLGILPHLPEDLSDPHQAALASHSVHHIRAILQIGLDRGQGRVLSVTSPGPGDGKTSLCMALGLSFAETGARTLLIDCDLAGGGLSARASSIVRRKIGRVLEREGLIEHDQLQEALVLASNTGRRLGEVLVELGYVTADQLDNALGVQESNSLGLMDVMAGEPLDACIGETGVRNLYTLPIGSAQAEHAAQLAPARLRDLLQAARTEFDVILVDTGPVVASVEASLVAAETDATIVVVSRGAQRTHADRVMAHLRSIGASLAGVVFNRADEQSFTRYGVSSSAGASIGRFRSQRAAVAPNGGRSGRFGPIASAVSSASHSPPNGNSHSPDQSGAKGRA